jgi:hypothetical protein
VVAVPRLRRRLYRWSDEALFNGVCCIAGENERYVKNRCYIAGVNRRYVKTASQCIAALTAVARGLKSC